MATSQPILRRVRRTGRPSSLRVTYQELLPIYDTPARRFGLLAMVAALLAAPIVASPVQIGLLNRVLLAVMAALALNLVTGNAGLISLGSAAFMAIGAFSAAAVNEVAVLPLEVSLLLGAVTTGVVGAAIAIPVLRLRGFYLVIGTLALHFIVVFITDGYQTEQVGAAGFLLPRPIFLGIELTSNARWYYVLLLIAGITTFVVTNVLRSPFGRAWMIIRSDDIAAEGMAIPVARYKSLAFIVSSVLFGIVGVLFAYYVRVTEVGMFPLGLAIEHVAMIVIGGLGSVLGSVFGAVFVVGMSEVVRSLANVLPDSFPGASLIASNLPNVQALLYGLSIVFFVLIEPHGLVQLWRRLRTWMDLWPFSRVPLDGGA